MSFIDGISGYFSKAKNAIFESVLNPQYDPKEDAEIAARAQDAAPIIWLLGSVAAGKSSITQKITGSTEAEVGTGFKACTRNSCVYDFPQEAPIVRFLDTRGLGEAGYDPEEDIAFCEDQAHLLMVVVRAMEPVQKSVVEVLQRIRKSHPQWPVVVAQTCLHEGYPPGAGHVLPYPYEQAPEEWNVDLIPQDLRRSLLEQRRLLEKIPGKGPIVFVPLDFTHPEDGLAPDNYGIDALMEAMKEAAPLGLEVSLGGLRGNADGVLAKRARPHVWGYASAAAAADLTPGVGLVAVPVVQGKMLHSLAGIYGVSWDKRKLAEFSGCLGSSVALRYGTQFLLRQAGKFVPVWGQTGGALSAATMSFATTYAFGKAACLYLARKRDNAPVNAAEISAGYASALSEAFDMRRRQTEKSDEALA